jgi:hypothetical protein
MFFIPISIDPANVASETSMVGLNLRFVLPCCPWGHEFVAKSRCL